jgi:hypothetical protein
MSLLKTCEKKDNELEGLQKFAIRNRPQANVKLLSTDRKTSPRRAKKKMA